MFVINGRGNWATNCSLPTRARAGRWQAHPAALQPQGKLFSEINWLAGHSPDQVQ
ncbi:hypothetical protein ACVXHB_17045 [Escherichia coli]